MLYLLKPSAILPERHRLEPYLDTGSETYKVRDVTGMTVAPSSEAMLKEAESVEALAEEMDAEVYEAG
jgi:hypothetical protein